MDIKLKNKYKSLEPFEWSEIPNFVVITGKNGTGKSQILQLINDRLTLSNNSHLGVIISGNFKKHEIVYNKSSWALRNTLELTYSTFENTFETIRGIIASNNGNNNFVNIRDVIREKYPAFNQLQRDDIKSLPLFEIFNGNEYLSEEFQRICYDYKIKYSNMVLAGEIQKDKITNVIGTPPWETLNNILKQSKLDFKVNEPSLKKFDESFHLKLLSSLNESAISFSELSSGEQVLITLIFLLFRKDRDNFNVPKLMLLDEPDAHLHPSLTKQFLEIIKNVFVDELGIRVIMTTHSPSTVALAPQESIFEMHKEGERIRKSKSKNNTIHLLTQGLVVAGEGTKYIIVEDKDDVNFYTRVYDILVDEKLISGDIPLIFIPVSTNGDSGGKTKVNDWADKLSSIEIIHGLIDGDNDKSEYNNVVKLERYCHENYLCDPIVLYSLLTEDGIIEQQFGGTTFPIKKGQRNLILEMDEKKLQKVTMFFTNYVHQKNSDEKIGIDLSDVEPISVQFSNGISLSYPKWLICQSGKEIINRIFNNKKIFNGNIHRGSLLEEFEKLRFIPLELITLFNSLTREN